MKWFETQVCGNCLHVTCQGELKSEWNFFSHFFEYTKIHTETKEPPPPNSLEKKWSLQKPVELRHKTLILLIVHNMNASSSVGDG